MLKISRKKFILDDTGSPMVEEGLLIGLAIMIFIAILAIISDLLKWINDLYQQISNNPTLLFSYISLGLLQSNATLDDYIDSWTKLPIKAIEWLKQIFTLIVYMAGIIGGIMIVWGAIEWATGYDDNRGKKNIIRGAILMLIALAPAIIIY